MWMIMLVFMAINAGFAVFNWGQESFQSRVACSISTAAFVFGLGVYIHKHFVR